MAVSVGCRAWISRLTINLTFPGRKGELRTPRSVDAAPVRCRGRTALLLGLNCGFTKADIGELVEHEHVINGGTHISKVRSKLRHKKTKVKPVWWLWPETVAALRFGLTSKDVDREYTKFRAKFNLPEQKALRKTTAQVIEDHVGESESLLFRGENKGGTHYKHYIKKYTPEQVAKLDAALKTAKKVLFGIE